MSPGAGSVASFLPVGPIAANNSADQTLIATFASRLFSCSSWKNVTEDANLWGLFLKWKQQNWVMEIPYCFYFILLGIVQALVFSICKNKHPVTAAYLIRQLEHWILFQALLSTHCVDKPLIFL